MKNGKQEQEELFDKMANEASIDLMCLAEYAFKEDISVIENHVKELILNNDCGRALTFIAHLHNSDVLMEEHKTNYNALLGLILENIRKELRIE